MAAMKKVLSLLLAFVFLQVQSWALSGGPVFAGSTAAVKGTYAGSLIPAIAGNSLGIFALGVPATGLASGIFAIFAEGGAFYGSIVGVIDPDKLTLNALAQAQQNETEVIAGTNGQVTIISIPVALATGAVRGILKQQDHTGFGQNNSGFRVTGTGTLQLFSLDPNSGLPVAGAVLDVTVDGFQQSTTVDSTINLNTLTGTQGSTGSGS